MALLCLLLLFARPLAASGAQAAPSSLAAAAAATELPLGPWGLYSRQHSGPCYLANRFMSHLFAFPIVIGQRRSEVILRTVTGADGKKRFQPERVALLRRMLGLSPAQGLDDDRPISPVRGERNRQARITEGNAAGSYWKAQATFAPAVLMQNVAPALDAEGQLKPIADWGRGEVTVELFPAYADPRYDGLLLRVTLANRSERAQTYYVDLLGGMGASGEVFAFKDLTVLPGENGDDVVIRHPRSDTAFALMTGATPFPTRCYQVSDDYFAPNATLEARNAAGIALPSGRFGKQPLRFAPPRKPRPSQRELPGLPAGATPQEAPIPPTVPDTVGRWGLLRVDEITVEPEKSVTVMLCIGTGKHPGDAVDSAETLLSLVGPENADGKSRRINLYPEALAAHQKARFSCGNPALERLMAQSLANTPFVALRRVGVPSRQETADRDGGEYQAVPGGLTALAWMHYRPEWAATQLNAFFLTRSDPNAPLTLLQATPPTNLFALWELFQRVPDGEMLRRFYPFARRRYRELLAAGRVKGDPPLYGWPSLSPAASAARSGSNRTLSAPRFYAPDYSAYVIRAARIMQRIASALEQPAEEIQSYERDAAEATRALNVTLWDEASGRYASRPVSAKDDSAISSTDSLTALLPLIAGADAQSPAQRAALLRALSDPKAFWSAGGLRRLAKSAPAITDPEPRGSIPFGLNWMLWKALLDLGEADIARRLAENLIRAYSDAEQASNACPEWIDGDSTGAGGADDYAGAAGAIIALHAAYHLPGTVTGGWDTQILKRAYDPAGDTLEIVLMTGTPGGKTTLLCAMGQPGRRYVLAGMYNREVVADADGVLTLTVPQENVPMTLRIEPAREG